MADQFIPGQDPLNRAGLRTAHVGPDAVVTRHSDGTMSVAWPSGRAWSVEMTTDLLEAMVEQYNDRVRDLAAEHRMRVDAEAMIERLQGEAEADAAKYRATLEKIAAPDLPPAFVKHEHRVAREVLAEVDAERAGRGR